MNLLEMQGAWNNWTATPFASQQFDLVMSTGSIKQMPDQASALMGTVQA